MQVGSGLDPRVAIALKERRNDLRVRATPGSGSGCPPAGTVLRAIAAP
ncbi:hypothetical protein JJD41_05190 [Oxynema sp. CENA135]|nr:hypothetical protein [Oxynema sp. CENA135]